MTVFDLAASLEATKRQSAEGCVKVWEDLARYRLILSEYQPTLTVELGTFSGRSAVWFAVVGGCDVITVDVHMQVSADTMREAGARVTWVTGSSTDPTVVSMVRRVAVGHERVIVVLDSDHSAVHVRAELDAYADLVAPGGWCVVEDTLVRWMPWEQQPEGPYAGSPYDAVDGFLADHAEWEADARVEGMLAVTQHPGGWLRRRE